jgi:molybdopterin biosynthesis enzyme MoaB
MLSRGVAGVRDRSLVVNLPGRPRAAEECFEVVAPVLVHALRQVAREDDWGDVIEQMHGNAWS